MEPENHNHASVSFIIALTGDISVLERSAFNLLSAASQWINSHPEHEIVVVADGPIWSHITRDCVPPIQVIKLDEPCHLPARLFNMGLEACTSTWVAFGLPGIDVQVADGNYHSSWFTNVQTFLSHIPRSSETVGIIGKPGSCEVQKGKLFSHRLQYASPNTPDARYPYSIMAAGWLEMFDLIPMHNSILNREYIHKSGNFMEFPIMQRAFWWQMSLHLARKGDFHFCELPAPKSQWCIEDYPVSDVSGSNASIDTLARVVSRYAAGETSHEVQKQLISDFPEFKKSFSNGASPSVDYSREDYIEQLDIGRWPEKPMRVTILGGPNEPLHSEIFFLNYFRLLEGKGLLNWRVIDDIYVTHTDIDQSDLIILCRVRSEEAGHALDYARQIGKPVLYMLDDNWFTIGADWPETYGNFIYPGSPFYENALYCIRNSDAVYTSSHVMGEYLEGFSKYLFMFPMNINLSAYKLPENYQIKKETEFLVGYAGTPRYDTVAFKALVELAKRRNNVKIYYLGYEGSQVFQGQLPPDRIIFVPGTHSYTRYAQRLARLAPDIGIAPLGTTEIERAKNPSKYLDYAAAHCVGVYSQVEPYTSFIKHGKTGWLVPGNNMEDWVNAIEVLLDDRELLESMREASYLDVQKHYSTEKILPQFLRMLSAIYYRDFS